MNAREFFYLTAQMRHAQKEYLKDRTQTNLRRARALEGEIDREIFRVKEIEEQRTTLEGERGTPSGDDKRPPKI